MFTLSAFADEIDPNPEKQVEVLKSCGVRYIEFRSIHKANVLALSDLKIREFKSLLDKNGLQLSAIGSPIGKVRIDEPFEPHLQRFHRAIELSKVFGTPNIRIFSYYPAEGATEADWPKWRDEVMTRMSEKARRAEKAGVRLFHENEHRIYGDSPNRITDLFTQVRSTALRAAFDPANFVFCGYDPWQGWQASKPYTAHLHIKDWVHGEEHGRLAGEGDGQIPRVMADMATSYDGFATLEPHLLGGGPTGGVTGPELFPKAVAAFRAILDRVGADYQ
ncbi:MAG: sugar phosphate isomerase/epimerase family protein [Gemmataceae bacterium]